MNCTGVATTFVYDGPRGLLLTEAKDVAGGNEDDRFTEYKYGDSNEKTQQTKKTVKLYTDGSGGTLEDTAYDYNLQSRMATVKVDSDADGNPNTQLEYEYNDSGMRVAQTEKVDANDDGDFSDEGDTTEGSEYLVDEHNPTGYAQVLEEWLDGTLAKTYTIGHDVFAEAAAAGVIRRLLKDGHGSTRMLVDAAGAIVVNDMGTPSETSDDVAQVFRYDAYGNAIGFEQGAALTTLLYSGEQTDAATGLQYLRARYYDPATGTFNRLDPFFGRTDDPISLHKYLYTHADPVNGLDPAGLMNLVTTLGVIGLAWNISATAWDAAHLAVALVNNEIEDVLWYSAWLSVDLAFLAVPYSGGGTGSARAFALAFSEGGQLAFRLTEEFLEATVRYGGVRTLYGGAHGIAQMARTGGGSWNGWTGSSADSAVPHKLTKPEKDAYRKSAREVFEKKAGKPLSAFDMVVHHRIPLEWSHVFPRMNPNHPGNIAAVDKFLHSTQINAKWTNFKALLGGKTPTQKQVLDQAKAIDDEFGSYLTYLDEVM